MEKQGQGRINGEQIQAKRFWLTEEIMMKVSQIAQVLFHNV